MADALVNDLGIAIIITVVALVVALFVLNVAFQLFRSKALANLEETFGKPLAFHSPDDAPRNFKQFGFVNSVVGCGMLNAWVVFFAVGYVYMVVFCWLSYAPLFYAPTFALEAFGGWNGLLAPWLVIFTAIHVIGMALILTWDAMRTFFMFPVTRMAEATHVMIEEDVSCMTDAVLVDPDTVSQSSVGRLRKRVLAVKLRFDRAKCRTVLPVTIDADGTRRIEYTCVRYVYSADEDSFFPTGFSGYTPDKVHEALRRGGMTQTEAEETMATCGKNEINVYVPGIFESLVREFSDFTYVFNSVGTWSYMIYSSWNIGIFWLLLTLSSGIFRSLFIVRQNQKKIRELAQLHTECKVLRDGAWTTIPAADLVLGDVVCVEDGSSKLPCDGVVIEGSLVVNESMLTGEPMPIQKMPVEHSQHATITKKNIAYAGTTCLQSTGPEDGKALLVATAVGALTTRGQLVRMVLFPTSVRFKYNDQLPVVYMILCVYMVVLCAIYLSPLVNLHSWIASYLFILNNIAMCLSPMLPVSMVMGQSVTARRLEVQHKIRCLQPGRIPIAGKISTMVFDKTGTITKDGMDFDAVISVQDARFGERIRFESDEGDDVAVAAENAEVVRVRVPVGLRHAIASCHTVTTLRDGMLVGNQVEVSMVKAAGWTVGDISLTSPSGDESLEVVKKLDFDHHRMTSGVVVRCAQAQELKVYIKGGYEKVEAIADAGSVPVDYDSVTQRCAKDGYYVLGIAHKSLPHNLTPQQLADMSRDSLESGLSVCGLLLFRNEMKKDSPDAIRELRKGSIRSVICTGDNALTGISIGRQCGIVASNRRILLGDQAKGRGGGELHWRDPDVDGGDACDAHAPAFADCQLVVTQSAWRHLHGNAAELDDIWTRLVVFARMKPEDKINVVKFFQSKNLVVGMCGDGGNDCGGLRAAHAGLALSDAEASMVSPFATGRDGKSLLTVVDLIREGRACLATNLATFQYFIVYAFTLTTIRTILVVLAALSLGEYVWLTMDVGIGIVMVWTMMQSKPTKELCSYRPTATLLGLRTIVGIVFPYITAIVAVVVAEVMMWAKPWYEQLNPLDDIHLLPAQWMLRGDNYDSAIGMIALILALVNTAYVNTYGGRFRQNIMCNWMINVVYAVFLFALFWLLLTPASEFNCIYRVNCDTKHSLQARDLTVLAAFSAAGGIGGCFLGPQVKIWQEEMTQAGWNKTEYWLPEPAHDCLPPPGMHTTPVESPEISNFGCVGPNNCYAPGFRWQVAIVFVAYILINHWFVKFILQGPVSATLRRRQKRGDRALFGETIEGSGQNFSEGRDDDEAASDPDLQIRM